MKKVLILLLIVFGLSISGFIWWNRGSTAVDPQETTTKRFLIPKGKTIREIAKQLKDENLINDPIIFFLYVKVNGKDKDIQAGDYSLSPSMNLEKVVDTLLHGVQDIWVTIPEGLRGEEVAEIVQKHIPSYQSSWENSFIENTGYLFPDTYLVPINATEEGIIAIMKDVFYKKINEIGLSQDSSELPRIITMASLIEREAKTDDEKGVIAGIITNRLTIGMPLQIDATVQYAKGYDDSSKRWWPTITQADYKEVNSSYNTYLNPGLPPQPISNPGLASIKAAYKPEQTEYFYYLHDKDGKIHFAKTVQEHSRNVAKYIE